MKIFIRFLLITFVLVFSSLLFGQNPSDMDPLTERFYRLGFGVPPSPMDAPDLTVPDLSGKRVSLSDQRGKVVLLNLWATWCPPCRAEMPAMEKVYQELKDENFTILAISTRDARETRQKVVDYINEEGYTFPVLFDETAEAVPGFYHTGSIPTSYVIDKNGTVVARLVGAFEWDTSEVVDLLRELGAQ